MVLENCELPYANHGHVILADPSPILFYPISSTEVRCLVDVPGQKVPSIANGEMTNYLKTVVAPQVYICALPFSKKKKKGIYVVVACYFSLFLIHVSQLMLPLIDQMIFPLQVPPEIHDSFVAAIDKGNIRTMPNRSMPAAPHPTPGALLMGDAFNMRHPLTGGGMTVALSDIVVLRNLLRPLRDLNDAPTLCKYLESFYTLRKVS